MPLGNHKQCQLNKHFGVSRQTTPALCVQYIDVNGMIQTASTKSTDFGGVSVMVWAGIHRGGRTAPVRMAGALTGNRHRDEILKHHVIAHMFQHDSAKRRAARPNITIAGFKPNLWDALDQLVR